MNVWTNQISDKISDELLLKIFRVGRHDNEFSMEITS